MAEYDIAFGERLADTARMVVTEGMATLDAQRTVLYLGLLSAEISLKAMLERAGRPVSAIRARSHRLATLLLDLGQCEVEVEIAPGTRRYVSASRLRGRVLKHGDAETTVGAVIDAESQGASTYPNQIRYGDILRHFPAEVVAQMAKEVSAFARDHWSCIRIKSTLLGGGSSEVVGNAMTVTPDERSGTGPAGAGEHYARLSTEDLKGLLQAKVLSESDAQIVSHELAQRGFYAPTNPPSRAQALGEFLLVLVVFVLVMSTVGRASPITYLLMYLSIFVPCFIAAILASRIVPKYRSLPYSDLVVRTTRAVAVLGVIMAFGLWYGQRGAG